MRNCWTAERVSLLLHLWARGATAQAIGAQLGGLSRSAVLGKILRLRRGAAPGSAPQARPAPRPRKRNRPPAASGSGPKRLVELTNTCCRWPMTQPGARSIFFCGAPEADLAGGVPYCAYHVRRAYVIPPKRFAAKLKAASAAAQSDAALRPRGRYVWRAAVRHPAPRRR